MVYKKYLNNSFNFYGIETDKFKTFHIEIVFYKNINENDITKENVLIENLISNTLKYPKKQDFLISLEELYNASIYSSTTRFGNVRVLSISLDFLDPIYVDDNYLDEVLNTLFEVIFNPNIKFNEFDLNTTKKSKNKILSSINSAKESPSRYAIKQALIYNSNDPSSYKILGNIDDLNKINNINLVDTYKKLFQDYYCDIYLIGNLNMDKLNIKFEELFKNDVIKNNKLDVYYETKINKKVKRLIEKDDFKQTTLVNIYNLDNLNDFERNYVMDVFNNIFGGSSLTNKLYKYLREDNSLCYNVSSMYQKYDQKLIVYTSIDLKNKNKAIKLIDKALNEMINKKFSDEDIKNSISLITNNLISSKEIPTSLINNYFFHNVAMCPLIDEKIENINNVTKKDIVSVAKKIKLSTIYIMGGQNERN